MWVIERAGRLRLTRETSLGLRIQRNGRREELQRDLPLQAQVLGEVDDAHPACAYLAQYAIVRHGAADHRVRLDRPHPAGGWTRANCTTQKADTANTRVGLIVCPGSNAWGWPVSPYVGSSGDGSLHGRFRSDRVQTALRSDEERLRASQRQRRSFFLLRRYVRRVERGDPQTGTRATGPNQAAPVRDGASRRMCKIGKGSPRLSTGDRPTTAKPSAS